MLAGRIAAIGGADLLCDTFFARMERGGGLPSPMKLRYFPDEALELTQHYERVIVAGTRRPVAFKHLLSLLCSFAKRCLRCAETD
jgi:acetolactate synthase-1/2/3 large subunit